MAAKNDGRTPRQGDVPPARLRNALCDRRFFLGLGLNSGPLSETRS